MDSGKSGDGTIQVHDEDAALEQKYDLGDSLFVSYFSVVIKNKIDR